jgi:hypothetical protein
MDVKSKASTAKPEFTIMSMIKKLRLLWDEPDYRSFSKPGSNVARL